MLPKKISANFSAELNAKIKPPTAGVTSPVKKQPPAVTSRPRPKVPIRSDSVPVDNHDQARPGAAVLPPKLPRASLPAVVGAGGGAGVGVGAGSLGGVAEAADEAPAGPVRITSPTRGTAPVNAAVAAAVAAMVGAPGSPLASRHKQAPPLPSVGHKPSLVSTATSDGEETTQSMGPSPPARTTATLSSAPPLSGPTAYVQVVPRGQGGPIVPRLPSVPSQPPPAAPVAATPSQPHVVQTSYKAFEGLLERKCLVEDGRDAKSKKWQTGYTVLAGTTLYFFKDEKSKRKGQKPVGFIMVPGKYVDVHGDAKKKHSFMLGNDQERYVFSAPDAATKATWVSRFQVAPEQATGSVSTGGASEMEAVSTLGRTDDVSCSKNDAEWEDIRTTLDRYLRSRPGKAELKQRGLIKDVVFGGCIVDQVCQRWPCNMHSKPTLNKHKLHHLDSLRFPRLNNYICHAHPIPCASDIENIFGHIIHLAPTQKGTCHMQLLFLIVPARD
eukprot:m.1044148 g.1044148  ORF g.1044148 m.1044148 type:complete len:498 (-) comp24169_c0_seq1:46-1539(-)